jgi:hypothetical protein
MSVTFYPHDEDVAAGSLKEKLEVMMEAAERYRAIVLDSSSPLMVVEVGKRVSPKEIKVAFNWQEIAKMLRETRELPENTPPNKAVKSDRLMRLSEIYEVLRGAKMPKLESVRALLASEANQLRAGLSGGAGAK